MYSSDLNPVEELFSKVKTTLKSADANMTHVTDLQTLLLASFTQVWEEDCKGWTEQILLNIYNIM